MSPADSIDRRLRISGAFVIAGLLVEALCLAWTRPIAFILFVGVGGTLVAIGVLAFLYLLVSIAHNERNPSGMPTKNAEYKRNLP